MSLRPFHLAVPVDDLEKARCFYVETLGCRVGRASDRWIDFDFFGHQLTVHLVDEQPGRQPSNTVDGKQVPVRHFGVVLSMAHWRALVETLEDRGVDWLIQPHVRFPGEIGEQATMFLQDPAGNGLEFKAFEQDARLFAS
jgi:extradiol dioxygenase family protein